MEKDKRILQELRSLHCDPHPYCSIFPSESDFSKCLFCHEKVSAQQRLHILEYINRFPFIMLLHRLFLYFQRHILVHRLAVILERSVSHHNVQCLETDQTLLCNVLLLWVVVNLSVYVQTHFGMSMLITKLGVRKLTEAINWCQATFTV